MTIATVDPTTGKILKTFTPLTAEELDARIALAAEAFRTYRRTSYAQRATWLRAAADALEADVDATAALMTQEMGKPLAQAAAEVKKCAGGMRYYAEHGERLLADEPADAGAVGASRAWTRWQPLGPVLAIMPWNFPLWQAVRFAAPALMAGNVGLLKHAPSVPQTALLLEEVLLRGGFPRGVFQTLLVEDTAVESVLRDKRVVAATLTGSVKAGGAVAGIAGSEVKKVVLELGGSDAFVVLPSADLDKAAQVAVKARCQNNGQSCIAAKRFLVHTEVYDAFAEKFVAGMAAQKLGDPTQPDTDLGPLVSERARAGIADLVADAVGKGASVLTGGAAPDQPGWFFPATVLADLTPEMRVWSEEVFGPVAMLVRVQDADEALAVANGTDFGLGANVWTTDEAEVDRFVEELESGMVAVNGMVASYPDLPFGGIKTSGHGRELADLGIKEFCNAKAVWVA